MNAIARALWKLVPNKAMVLYCIAVVCVIMTFAGGLMIYGFYNLEVRGSETMAQISHNHFKRLSEFNVKSIEANRLSIAILDDRDGFTLELTKLRRQFRDHETNIDAYLDENDNFKSDRRRLRYERHKKELSDDIKTMERKLKGYRSDLIGQQMIASRAR